MIRIEFRPAVPDDADLLADLVNQAGEGIPMLVWQGMAEPGESALEVGRRRARRDTGAFSYRNAVMAVADGTPAGALIDYRIPDAPEPIGPDTPPIFVPLNELENEVCGSWYVNVLAVVPALRGHGIGAALLAEAERRGRAAGAKEMSIIVSNGNAGARRLYHRAGYRLRTERPMVKPPGWENAGTAWELLVKTLTG